MIDWQPEYTKSVWYTLLAAIGGSLGFLYRETEAGRTVRFMRFLIAAAVAGFLGYHLTLYLQAMGFSEGTIGSINGVVAFFGVDFTLKIFNKLVLKNLGLSHEERVKQELIAGGWKPPAVAATMDKLQQVSESEGNKSGTGTESK